MINPSSVTLMEALSKYEQCRKGVPSCAMLSTSNPEPDTKYIKWGFQLFFCVTFSYLGRVTVKVSPLDEFRSLLQFRIQEKAQKAYLPWYILA